MSVDLVTGASGLVGGNLVRALSAQGRRVRVLARRTSNLAHLADIAGLERVEGDLQDQAALERAFDGIEDVYHCAAMVNMNARMKAAMWQTNVTGTENILRQARKASIRRLVHCSSVDAIGLSFGKVASTGEAAWNWDALGLETAYARTKYEAQQRVLAAAHEGLDAVVVCPTYMLGAFDTHPSSGKMIVSLAGKRVPGYPLGGNNFVDVEDVALGMICAAQAGRRGELYILGNQNLTYQEMFCLIADVLGCPRPTVAVPYLAARLAGWWGDMQGVFSHSEPEINTSTVRLGYFYHYYDPAKAVRELSLPQTPVETAVVKAVNWFRSVGMLPALSFSEVR